MIRSAILEVAPFDLHATFDMQLVGRFDPTAVQRHLGRITRVLLSALLLPAALAAQQFPADDDLQLMLQFIARDGRANAMVFGVLEADGTTRVASYGRAEPSSQPPDARTVFEIGSITKTFTATLLADMVLRGEVGLDDPVAKHLPQHVSVPSRGGREITLLDLATHRSGLPAMPDNVGPRNPSGIYPGYGVDSLYAFLAGHELEGVPGAGYLYSNVNYGLLGHVLAQAAGTSFHELLRARILAPLGMNMTDVAEAGPPPEAMVSGYRNGSSAPHWQGTEALQGAGAMRSTAEDMLKYLRAQLGPPRTHLERAMRMAREIQVPDGDDGAGHGLAWRTIVAPDGDVIVMHGGVTAGFSGRIAMMPGRQTGTILLANERTFGSQHGGGAGLLFPLPPARQWVEAPVAPELLARYEATYSVMDGRGSYDVRLEDEGHLTLPRGGDRTRLHATSDTTFYVLGSRLALTFRAGEDGRMRVEARRRTGDDAEVRWAAVAGRAGSRPPLQAGVLGLFVLVGMIVLVAVLRARSSSRGSRV
jgi:serine-type D-Ala-D-Ala carboxypeptidase/endopeptidase